MGKKRATDSASPPAPVAGAGASSASSAATKSKHHTPTIADPSSSAVSASFPYIKVGGGDEKDSSNSESGSSSSSDHPPPKSLGHVRLASLSSLRPKPDPVRAAAALSRFNALIRSQTLMAKGLPASSTVEIDIHASDAPWRTDDSLLSPLIAEQYLQYVPVVDMALRYIDESGSLPVVAAGSKLSAAHKEQLEFARYISLARFGEIEQNAWKIFKRIAKQKRDDRVRTRTHGETLQQWRQQHSSPHSRSPVLTLALFCACARFSHFKAVVWLSSSGSIDKDWTFGDLYSRICVFSLHLRETLKIPKGARAILCFVPCLEFFVAFWACLSQGIVAVPVSPVDPFNPKV